MTQNLTVPLGEIKLVCYDDRDNSSSYGQIDEIYLGIDKYQLVIIPPNIWYGFQGIKFKETLIVNCTDLPHDPCEIERKENNDVSIPYKWLL